MEEEFEEIGEEIKFWKDENMKYCKQLVGDLEEVFQSRHLEVLSQIKVNKLEINEWILQQNKDKAEIVSDIHMVEQKCENLEIHQNNQNKLISTALSQIKNLSKSERKRSSISSSYQIRSPSRNKS